VFNVHNHAGDPTLVNRVKLANALKARAVSNQEPSRRIIAEELQHVSEPVAASVSISNMARNIRRNRQAIANVPVMPRNLLNDSGPGQHRTLIFSTQRDLEALRDSPSWAADGTFSVAPPLFQQLYTIHIRLGFQYVPVVYILMSERTDNAYRRALEQLRHHCPTLAPTKIYTDFELAAINGFQKVFTGVQMKGSFSLLLVWLTTLFINRLFKVVTFTIAKQSGDTFKIMDLPCAMQQMRSSPFNFV
jgi:hypothetical protein